MLSAKQRISLDNMPFIDRANEAKQQLALKWTRGPLVSRTGIAPQASKQKFIGDSNDSTAENPMLMFGSNSYLNLNNDTYVIERVIQAAQTFGIGSGGSPLFSGYTKNHKDLETRLAEIAGHEDALLLPSGYLANVCWVNGLIGRNDYLLYDKNSHASVFDGLKMARGGSDSFDPEDPQSLIDAIQLAKKQVAGKGQIFATVEGVRSIDGGIANLPVFIQICKENGVISILDDAHGLGVLGETGKGTLEHFSMLGEVDFRMSTCSKALGAQGAFFSGPRAVINYLRVASTPYMFTTALAQTTIAAINAALDVIEQDNTRIEKLLANARYLERELLRNGFQVGQTETAIVPLYTGDLSAEMLCSELDAKGLFVNAIEFPLIPPKAAPFLRFSLMAEHETKEIDHAISILRDATTQLRSSNAA